MSTALVAAGTGGLAVATNSICNGIVQCMDASANNRMRVDRQKFDHELSIQSAQFTREREQNQHEIKEQFGKNILFIFSQYFSDSIFKNFSKDEDS